VPNVEEGPASAFVTVMLPVVFDGVAVPEPVRLSGVMVRNRLVDIGVVAWRE